MRKLYVLAVMMAVAGCVPPEGEQAPSAESIEQSITSGCYVTVYCSDGTSRTCSGASACSAAPTGSPPSVTCDGVSSSCSTPPPPTGCTISGVTYSAGTVNPSNTCQVCDPARSTTSWSNRDSLVINYNCKENFEVCLDGPCGGNWCDSDAYCSARCVGGQEVCD
jgi:hypothetical protein